MDPVTSSGSLLLGLGERSIRAGEEVLAQRDGQVPCHSLRSGPGSLRSSPALLLCYIAALVEEGGFIATVKCHPSMRRVVFLL